MSLRIYNIDLIAANALFGISYSVIISLLEQKLTPQQLFTIIILFGAAIFIPLALLNNELHKIKHASIPTIFICAIITLYGWLLLTLTAGHFASATNIAALSTLGPSITLLAAAIQSKHYIVKTLTLLCATSIILWQLPNKPLGNALILIGVTSMAISTVIIKQIHRRLATTTLLACYFSIALLILPIIIPNFPKLIADIQNAGLSQNGYVLLAYLPSMGMALPLYLLYRGARALTPFHTALYRFIQPLIALITIVITQKTTISTDIKHLTITLIYSVILLILARLIIPKNL